MHQTSHSAQSVTKATPEAAAALFYLNSANCNIITARSTAALPTDRHTDWRTARVNRVLPHRAYELKLED